MNGAGKNKMARLWCGRMQKREEQFMEEMVLT
jgi:hypothetical protein